jgi:3-oxoacyl-[acyl-carrier-protein] synthase-1
VCRARWEKSIVTIALAVTGAGMVTAVGYNAPASLAALRAGISGIATQAWQDPLSGEPFRCARVSLPQRWGGARLFADLVAPAILECLQAAGEDALQSIPILLGISEPNRAGRPPGLEREILDVLHGRLGCTGNKYSRVFPAGQTGCAQAMLAAQNLIEARRAHAVVIAGVDSFVERVTLESYAYRRRILSPANFNGFLPGEAGTAVLVTALPPQFGGIRITGCGFAQELATIEDTKPFRGEGMTRAVRTALQGAGVDYERISLRVSDVSGEHYKFKEALFAAMRMENGPRAESPDLWHPIEFLGEIGAAILPCLFAWVAHAIRLDYAPGVKVLCHVGNDAGERAAFVVEGHAAAVEH